MTVKKIALLGSTGSIGLNTLKVVERFPSRFKITGLTAYKNFELLGEQIKKFNPLFVAVNRDGMDYLKKYLSLNGTKVFNADTDIPELVASKEVDTVVLAIGGSAALSPFLNAVRAGKTVAPANKEALVMAGHIIMSEVKKYGARIVPIDSEQSAIFQCLEGKDKKELKRIYLTASGGPLWNVPKKKFDKISIQKILKHPRWKMGKKITVDSATLMNKGLEVIEAKWLFDVDVEQINVLIHPEAVIHSMVEFKDGSILAQLGVTDMRLPIQYALTYPKRLETDLSQMDFSKLGKLTFKKPDLGKFPAVDLCYHVAKKEGTYPCVLNAANEEAVKAFLEGSLKFSGIYKVAEKVVLRHRGLLKPTLNEIWQADHWAREEAQKIILS